MGIGINIRLLREMSGMTQAELAEKLDVSRVSVINWETDKKAIRKDNVKRIAKIFNVDTEDITSEHYGIAAQLANGGKIESHKPRNAFSPRESNKAYAPLVGKVHAGEAQEPELIDDVVSVPYEVMQNHPKGYLLKVEGDCMNKVYPEGCLVLIDPSKEPVNGSIAVVSINGADYVMRRLYKGASSVILSPSSFNDVHKDIVILEGDETTVEYAGTVVWFQPEKELE